VCCDHLAFINQLLPTVNAIPSTMLRELAQLAVNYETAIIRNELGALFVDAAILGLCPDKEEWSAANFFDLLIKIVNRRPAGKALDGRPKQLIMLWLSITDPLGITECPETGYGQHRGVMS